MELSQETKIQIALEKLRKRNNPYKLFQQKYFDDPVGFVYDCFFWDKKFPVFYQIKILDAVQKHKKVSARGPRGMGKTSVMSWLIWWFCLTRDGYVVGDDWKCITTASVNRQLKEFLWPEVHKWFLRLNWDVIGRTPLREEDELLQMGIKLKNGHATAANSNKPDTLEGGHADNVLYVFDESKIIPDQIFDSVEGAFSSPGNHLFVAFSTPGYPSGRFYDIHKKKPGLHDWHTIHVSKDDAIKAKRITTDWVGRMTNLWGVESSLFQQHVLGNFAADDEDSVVPLFYIETANNRHFSEFGDKDINSIIPDVIGVDIGYSKDPTVIAYRTDGNKVFKLEKLKKGDSSTSLMSTAGKVATLLDRYKKCIAVLDIDGVGAGVVHRLREMGYKERIIGFNNGGSPMVEYDLLGENKYRNNRAAMWWMARQAMNPDVGDDVALPENDNLLGELTSLRRKQSTSDRVITMESKADIKKRLGRSTDYADAVLMALYGPMLMPLHKPMKIVNLAAAMG